MSDYLDRKVKPLRRAIILQFLDTTRDNQSNADILTSVINGTPDGITVYYTDVVEDLRWLEARGYVKITGEEVVVVEATISGLRVAHGDQFDTGIARRIPGV
ncbi:hypothetical protein [Palleronia caenipelagi]|uniref:ArsR family transcriptional regulator n=1 Tax=Palleronia caenipelagi TaxID=2489174 RepID=A0A547PW85_9RHOB|nr:hypothetical protein [Palleronia caenipelagi]TRD18381.1 hypothetical protein FEV53_12045 [Palleronia caenipelagi]